MYYIYDLLEELPTGPPAVPLSNFIPVMATVRIGPFGLNPKPFTASLPQPTVTVTGAGTLPFMGVG